MKKSFRFVLLSVLCAGLVGGIPGFAAPSIQISPKEYHVYSSDQGRQIELKGGHLLVVNLESNPSTGYEWQLTGVDNRVLRHVGTDWTPHGRGLVGSSGTTLLRFAGAMVGHARIDLEYRRPWERSSLKTFSVNVRVTGMTSYQEPPEMPVTDFAIGARSSTLPANLDWCSLGACTPIQDQGACGSCWAFSTVGALESSLLIKDGNLRNLSEQYLVSCNDEGWGCNGGWFAHDYHFNKYVTGETGAGAVSESDFPYAAANLACNPPHTHNEKLHGWAYLTSSSSIPSVDAIKRAILDYGPVSAGVCVNSAFQAYTGGVFASTKQCRSINHAIVLVGWETQADGSGAWILRNSWGTGWGENGTMRIAFGRNQVGYGANYVAYGCEDIDGDSFGAECAPGADCDDSNAAVNPAATEIACDDNDNDCNPATKDDPFSDGDGDGHSITCGDCNDALPTVYPGAGENCGDGLDNDCDGLTDVNDPDCCHPSGFLCTSNSQCCSNRCMGKTVKYCR